MKKILFILLLTSFGLQAADKNDVYVDLQGNVVMPKADDGADLIFKEFATKEESQREKVDPVCLPEASLTIVDDNKTESESESEFFRDKKAEGLVAAAAEDVESSFVCDKCSFVAPNERAMRMHNTTHDQTSFHMCKKCDFRLLISINVDHDSKFGSHPKNTPHVCNHCDKRFNSNRLLLRHKVVHVKKPGTKGSLFSCNRCTLNTIHRKKLAEHKEWHKVEDKKAAAGLLALGTDLQ